MAFGILYDFLMGQSIEAYRFFGAHFEKRGITSGVVFRLYAPLAEDVSVVGFHDCISYEQEAELARVTMYEPDRSVMAQLAVKRLLHKIENPGPPEGVMMAAGRIIERGSARKLSDSERRDL